MGGPPGRCSRGPPQVLGRGRWAALEVGVVQPTPPRFPQTHSFHPCWPRGYSTRVPLRDLYASPCTAAQRPQTFNGSDRVHLAGGSDPALCRGLVSGLFNFSSWHFTHHLISSSPQSYEIGAIVRAILQIRETAKGSN